MQLSTSTPPLDPVLAATASSPANPGAAAGVGTSLDGESSPEFSSLLASESDTADAETESTNGTPLAAELLNVLAGDPATSPIADANASASWLLANGSASAQPSVVDGELSEASTDSADVTGAANEASRPFAADSATASSVARTPGRGATTAFAVTESSSRAIARAYTGAANRQNPTTPVDAPSAEPALDQIADAATHGFASDTPDEAAAVARTEPHTNHATNARAPTAFPSATAAAVRSPQMRTTPLPTEAEGVDPHEIEPAIVAETPATAIPTDPSANRDRPAFAPHAPAAPAAPKPGEVLFSIRGDAAPEKFAAHGESAFGESRERNSRGEKHSLNAEQERVNYGSFGLGINVAKPETLMPELATSSLASPSTARVEHLSPAPASFDSLMSQAGQEVTEMEQAARRSIDSVLAVTERFATSDKRAVTLQFSVSGVDLGVHVQLREDGVHTTFRTDSPELRAALAQEWQAVTHAQASDRSSRFADPVFTSTSNGQSQSDANGADQRGSNPRQDRQFADDFAALNLTARAASAAPASGPTVSFPSATRSAPVSTSNRLHTFA